MSGIYAALGGRVNAPRCFKSQNIMKRRYITDRVRLYEFEKELVVTLI